MSGAVFLCCGGPSLEACPLEMLGRHGIMVAAVNNSPVTLWRLGRVRPQLWYSVDSPYHFHPDIFRDAACRKHVRALFCEGDLHVGEGRRANWRVSRNDVRRWDGKGWTVWKPATEFPNVTPYILDETGYASERFCDSSLPQWGRTPHKSVMLVALWYLKEFSRVYVLGADLHMEPKKPYAWEQRKDDGGCRDANETLHWLRDEALPQLLPVLASRGCEVRLLRPSAVAETVNAEATQSPFEHASGLYERT